MLELVDGDTLARRIEAGPIPVEDAVSIARQIAAGLEAAHELGIVHRDLKPANVALRSDGTTKILDFGLAKIAEPQSQANADPRPTPARPTSPVQSGVLGTAAYVSPEQARARESDKRSDVWAFGAVLYEMLSGERVFPGHDASETLAAVLRAEIDWSKLPPSTPPKLRQLLIRCLERDVTQRLRDIGEARIVLERLTRRRSAATDEDAPVTSAPAPLWRRLAPPIAGAVVAGALVAGILWPRTRPDGGPVIRFALAMTPDSTLLIDPQSRDLAITPDGAHVVYKGGPRIDQTQLFLYGLDQLEPKPLTGPGLPKGPFVSPDGRWVGFFEPRAMPGAALKKVAIGGGPALDLARLDGPSRGATWGDGVIVAASGSPATGLLEISAAGGEPKVLTRPDRERGESDHLWPHFLPGNTSVLFTITALSGGPAAAQIAVLDRASGAWRTILRGASQAHYIESGHLVYHAGNALWAVAFDLTRMEVTSPATMVVPRVVTLPTGVAEFNIARDGTLVYVARGGASESPRTLVWVDRQGRETPIAAPPRPYANVRLSPDGGRVALEIEDGDQDIWVWDLARSTLTKVTTDPGLDETPVWTPDGRRLVFTSQAGGVLGSLFSQAADGSGMAERLAESAFIRRATAVVPDGSRVVFSSGGDLMTLSLDQGRLVELLVRGSGGGGGADAAVSPDGEWLAYVAASGVPQIFVSPRSDPNRERTQITPAGGSQPRWASNGRELFYTALDGTLMGVSVTQGAAFSAGAPAPIFKGSYYSGLGILSRGGTYDVAPDGQRFLMLKPAGAPGERPEQPTVVVVKNWLEELKRLVPVRP